MSTTDSKTNTKKLGGSTRAKEDSLGVLRPKRALLSRVGRRLSDAQNLKDPPLALNSLLKEGQDEPNKRKVKVAKGSCSTISAAYPDKSSAPEEGAKETESRLGEQTSPSSSSPLPPDVERKGKKAQNACSSTTSAAHPNQSQALEEGANALTSFSGETTSPSLISNLSNAVSKTALSLKDKIGQKLTPLTTKMP